MKNGIKPSFVFSCETNPVDFFSNIITKNIHLVAFSCVSNINLRKWQGPVSFYNWMLYDDFYNELWDMAGKDLGFVATASIVTTQIISFVLGCNVGSIVLVGNKIDLRPEIPSSLKTLQGFVKSKSLNADFVETSAKTGEAVEEAFSKLARKIIPHIKE